jgi:DNA-binding SARP family transcriptional activator
VTVTPASLEVAAHALTAVLAAWLGLTVLTRSRSSAAHVFGFLSLALLAWSSSVIVQRLSTSPSVAQSWNGVEELAAALVIPATEHFSLVIATEGHHSRRQVRALTLAYILNVLFVLPGVLDRGHPVAISPPNVGLGPIPGEVLGWAWILTRLATLLAAAWWLTDAFRRTRRDDPRRRQLGITLATVAIGALGGIIRLFNVVGPSEPWIGVSLVTLAMVLSASVVFAAGVFFPADVARRAFWTSLALGLGIALLAAALLVVDAIGRRVLGLEIPLFTVMALVATIALYEPVATWGRSRLGGHPAAAARRRLLGALGQPALAVQAADAGVQPAITRVTQALELSGSAVIRRDGTVAASEGSPPLAGRASSIALVAGDEVMGTLVIGDRLSGATLTPGERRLLELSAAYVAAAMRTGRREDEQAEALSGLSDDRAHVESSAIRLHEAIVRHSAGRPGLRVMALGPLRVERGGAPVERWGGEKAGSRQALALFAFLFDRGERGVAKDEALELIWPDAEIERADLAFHRTLGGLRHTLDPDGGGRQVIRFLNDRYRLDSGIVEWTDVSAFLADLEQARLAMDRPECIRHLEAARGLYRGEYLDDCPFYGDGVHVEDRRASLRSRFIDLLVALGEGYEALGDRASSAVAYRDAVATAVDGCPPAEAGLLRLSAAGGAAPPAEGQ